MKRIVSVLLIGLLLALPAVATVTYDTNKTVTRNQVDALIAIANASIPLLNDVLFVDGDRTDDYTADGSFVHPFKTITAAKNASASGDVIVVSPGAYAEVVALTAGTTLFGWNVTGSTLTGNYVLLNGGNVVVKSSEIVINDDSADTNFRVESNGNTDAIFVDAGNDRVGVFTAAPTVPFDVTGASLFTGAMSIVGDVTFGGALKLKTCTIADGDATPDVTGCTVLTTSSNTAPTEITDLDNPVVGAIYIIIGGNATNSSTITDGGNFALSAGYTASVDEVLVLFVQADNDYVEITRATN